MNGSRRIVAPALHGSALVAVAVVSYVPALSHLVTTGPSNCLLRRTTGWSCPACGMSRSVVRAMHFDLPAALSLNPLALVALLGLVVAWGSSLARLRKATPHARNRVEPRLRRIVPLLVAVAAFTVVRNLA